MTNITIDTSDTVKRNNRRMGLIIGAVIMGMVGISYLSVPLYELFCQVTGWSGTPGKYAAEQPLNEVELRESVGGASRTFTVQFDANVQSAHLPWTFQPLERKMEVDIGQQYLAYYRATNAGDETTSGTATFNVTPLRFGQYFVKVECFCFTEQTLAVGESVDMPVSFYIDPAIMDDPELEDLSRVTLSYSFFPYTDG